MLRNYFFIMIRQLMRHKLYSLINILGLSVGIAACLLIFLFVQNERSFDAFHSSKDQVYRLCEVQSWDGIIPQKVALSMYPMGPNLRNDYPEVEDFARIFTWDEIPLEAEGKKIYAEKFYWTDSAFLDLFDFPFLHGEPRSALDAPNSLVISESTARKFGEPEDILGKEFQVRGQDTFLFKVTGIIKDTPDNSHLQFDGLISLNTLKGEADSSMMQRWGNNWLVTYLRLSPESDIAALEEKFPDFLTKYMGEGATDGYALFLQSLDEVHLGSADITHDYQNYRKFDGKYLGIFSWLGIFVLLIAGINFMNLSTARSARRAREVGIRKAIGATRQQLARQFTGESLMFATFALLLAWLISYAALPFLAEISQRELEFSTFFEGGWLLTTLGLTLMVGLFSGLYPALRMSGFDPIQALKGEVNLSRYKFSLQNVLVVAQFSIASALIVGTLLVTQQLRFMTDRNPGFDYEQVMLVPSNSSVRAGYETFRETLLANPAITEVSGSGQRLGNNLHQTGFAAKKDSGTLRIAISHVNVDYDYFDLYQIQLKDGRNFSREFATDAGQAFIINEALAKELGWEDPVGKSVKFGWEEEWGTVIGLTEDFNYNSLHHNVNPLAMSIQPDWGFGEISLRFQADKVQEIMPEVEAAWAATGTEVPFKANFLDEHFDELYRTDRQVSQVVGIIAGLAILVACLGLFGLISISAERRVKEIGIRKVLGASIAQLWILLSRSMVFQVLLAFVLAAPITWWFMEDWLQNFAFRIEINIWVFVVAGLIAVLIALATVSYRAFQAAVANPIDALRDE